MIIAICDDNVVYLEYLKSQIETFMSFVHKNITIISYSPDDLQGRINSKDCNFDLLITDIRMGEYNGINIANQINHMHTSCLIIFVSNYLSYATSVYDSNHIYFVLKSEIDSRLPKALEKAYSEYVKLQSNYINISYQNTNHRIALYHITYVESYGRYLHINTTDASHQYIDTLKNLSKNLFGDFIQIHKSYIINMNYISSLNRTNCILKCGTNLPISYTYSKKVLEAYITFVSNKISTK